jgi:spore coat protein YutH
MNNYINYYYNLYPEKVHQQQNFFYFKLDNEKYYFIPYNRSVDDINDLYQLNLEMINHNSLIHEIVLNKEKQPLIFINNISYILLKVYINEFKNINLSEIVFFNNQVKNISISKKLERYDWVKLWSEKIDYFEYQISHIGKKYPLLCECLSYFIGIGENAISYVKNTMLELKPTALDNLCVSHKRIKSDFTMFDLYNPIYLVIDYNIRDLSEYIKSNFFAGKEIWNELDIYFKNNKLSPYSLRLLYGRLLYPSFFFDIYEQIVEGNLKEETILSIVSKIEKYEQFLNDFYQYINVNNNIPPVSWINKTN